MEEWQWDGVSHRQRGEKVEGALKSTPGPTLARCCCRELPAAPHIPNPAPAGTQAALSLLSEERGSPNEPPKSLPLTFSHFQEKKKNPSRMLEGKTSITCCGELSSQEEPWCRLGSRSLWVAFTKKVLHRQIAFLLLLLWRWEMLFCRDCSTQETEGERCVTAPLSQTQCTLC